MFAWSLTEPLSVVEFTYSVRPLHVQEGVHGWRQVSSRRRIAHIGLRASKQSPCRLPSSHPVVGALISRHVSSLWMQSFTHPRERGVESGSGLGGPDHGRAPTSRTAWESEPDSAHSTWPRFHGQAGHHGTERQQEKSR